MLLYQKCGCKCEVRPLQIGRARCVRATQKTVATHTLVFTYLQRIFLLMYLSIFYSRTSSFKDADQFVYRAGAFVRDDSDDGSQSRSGSGTMPNFRNAIKAQFHFFRKLFFNLFIFKIRINFQTVMHDLYFNVQKYNGLQ